MNNVEGFFWNKIDDNLFTISSAGLEDFRAVFGAKTSRSIAVENKWNIDYDQVQSFLIQNLKEYGHASIGDMSFISVFHRGFGWLTAWLLEDDPLFNGQEVSSRAVNILKYYPDPCYDSNAYDNDARSSNEADIHFAFANIYSKIAVTSSSSYKFDDRRWALPGSVRTGVTVMMTARTFIRHMDKIRNISFAEIAAKNYMRGARLCAPAICDALGGRSREAPKRWNLFIEEVTKDNCITLTPPIDLYSQRENAHVYDFPARTTKNSYIPDEFNKLGLFKVEIVCSIAAARDWHRHRSVMPWTMHLATKNGLPFISSFYSDAVLEYKNEVDHLLIKGMKLINQQQTLQSLYSLPFGACVKLVCYAPINYLLYMLELRAFSLGPCPSYPLTK